MYQYLTPGQFAWAAAIAFGVLIVAAAVIQSQRSEDPAVLTQPGHGEADALVSELARCRTVTSDDAAVLEACRCVWAENRQHFFASTKSPQLLAVLAPNAPAVPVKSQDGVPPYETGEGRAR